MSSRVKLPGDISEIKQELKIDWDEIDDYQPRWNAAPTSKLPVVVSRSGERVLTLMRWGLIPSWAEGIKIGFSTINARVETIDTRPAFRAAWKAGRRCLVIVDGYYEWREADKQPFAVALRNGGLMTFAGLWDIWRAPDGGTLRSFTIIKTQVNDVLKPLHHRMPVLLAPNRWAAWLGETVTADAELKAMLKPYPGDDLAFWPVDRRVGNVRNDGPDLFAPLQEAV